MTTALAKPDTQAPMVTPEDVELIRRTIAKDATPEELRLFFYDNARRGVHPLDRMIHFTKRGGRYTPITSIDFMRSRAAETGEMAGSEDPAFTTTGKYPLAATVTVYRMTQGQRYAYTATARWDEYYPGDGAGAMWRKMPHTMLGKCAEALALRKAFPQQLAGLYAREEMDQAETAPEPTLSVAPEPEAVKERPPLVEGAVYIERVDQTPTRNKNVTRSLLTLSSGEQATTIKRQLADIAMQVSQENVPVYVTTKETKFGAEVVEIKRVDPIGSPAEPEPAREKVEPPTLDELSF